MATLHQRWLHGSAIRVAIVIGVFYWATGAHPIIALLLGLVLAEFVVMAEGRWLLRGFITWVLIDVVLTATQAPFWPAH